MRHGSSADSTQIVCRPSKDKQEVANNYMSLTGEKSLSSLFYLIKVTQLSAARPLTFCAGNGREGSVPRIEERLVEFPVVCEVGSLSM